jgi:hypothetical protein
MKPRIAHSVIHAPTATPPRTVSAPEAAADVSVNGRTVSDPAFVECVALAVPLKTEPA